MTPAGTALRLLPCLFRLGNPLSLRSNMERYSWLNIGRPGSCRILFALLARPASRNGQSEQTGCSLRKQANQLCTKKSARRALRWGLPRGSIGSPNRRPHRKLCCYGDKFRILPPCREYHYVYNIQTQWKSRRCKLGIQRGSKYYNHYIACCNGRNIHLLHLVHIVLEMVEHKVPAKLGLAHSSA